jgi:hypothetical protein
VGSVQTCFPAFTHILLSRQFRCVPFRQRVLLAVLLAGHPELPSLPLFQPTLPKTKKKCGNLMSVINRSDAPRLLATHGIQGICAPM